MADTLFDNDIFHILKFSFKMSVVLYAFTTYYESLLIGLIHDEYVKQNLNSGSFICLLEKNI